MIDDIKRYAGRPILSLHNPDSLAVLEQSQEIEVLNINHFPNVHSLEPLRLLTNLRALGLFSTPGWDGSNRHLLVQSFEPLAALQKLEAIRILAVVPEHGRLKPLSSITSLEEVSIGNTNFYQLEDFAELSVSLPRARNSLRPVYQMGFVSMCNKCKKYPELFLKGAKPRSPRYVCPSCGKKKIITHLERWNRAGGLPKYDSPEKLSPEGFIEKFGNPNLR